MKFFFLLISGFSSFIYFAQSLERLWLLRHCDKPKKNYDPCCTEIGEERTQGWIDYFTLLFNQKTSKIKIYTSNFRNNQEENCLEENISYDSNKQCQKSQRMFYTAYHIQKCFINNRFIINPNINIDYCIGEIDPLLENILNDNDDSTDVLLIWEHKEIIDIIRNFGIDISRWKRKHRHLYNLLFMIDIPDNKLYYDCYDYSSGKYQCISEIGLWLENFGTITQDYYQMENSLYQNNKNDSESDSESWKIFVIFLFFLFFFLNFLLISLLLYKCLSEYYELQKRRTGYTIIKDLETKPVHHFLHL